MAAAYGVIGRRNKATPADEVAIRPEMEPATGAASGAGIAAETGSEQAACRPVGGGRRRFLARLFGAVTASTITANSAASAQAQGTSGASPVPGQAPQTRSDATSERPRPASGRGSPIRLLVLGDSLSAGFGLGRQDGFQPRLQAALKARGFDVAMVDAAVSGDTSAGGRARLEWALADGADAAIVELGANDGLRGLDPREMQANLAAILDTLAARRIPVLLSGMYAPPNLGPDYQRAFRAVFDGLGKRPGVVYDPFFLEGVATVNALNQGDGIHPNVEGVRRIVARILPYVEKLLAEVRPA